MQRIVDYFKQYIGVISIVFAVCILLTYSLSYFMVNTGNKRVAEMYVGELKYSMTIEGNSTNTLSVPAGETIVDIDITNLNEIKTYFKLLYLKNSNVTISYYNETKDTSNNITKYLSAGDLIEKSTTSTLKLKIINNSTSKQTLTFSVSGGYSTNKLTDVEVPSTYSEITTLETAASNTYFCKTTDTLTQGLEYVDGQYTYRYNQYGDINYTDSTLKWTNNFLYYASSVKGWGVQLTDKTSTEAVTDNVCSYINNKPLIFTSHMYYESQAPSINLSGIDTHNVYGMMNMFRQSEATSLDVSGFNTSHVANMGGMFYQTKTSTLDVGNFNTSNVIYMNSMFSWSNATKIDGLNNFNTSKVINMNWMFGDSAATSLDLSNFDTKNVTDMSSMFHDSKAASLDVSNFDTSNVTDMTNMFKNTSISSLDVSNFNTSKVTSMSSMFMEISASKIIGLDKFDTSKVKNMLQMFMNAKVTELDLSSFDTSNVTDMTRMLLGVNVDEIKGLENFNTSNVTTMDSMFRSCKSSTINVSNFDTSKVTNMANLFAFTENENLDISNFDTSNVTDMSYMFYGSKVKTIYASDKFVTDAVTSDTYMFRDNSNLVGGNGTKFNSSYIDKTYARIDTASTPGYFTLKSN